MSAVRYVAATNNAHKLDEMRAILAPLGIELASLADVGFSGDIAEDGETFEQNALIKARTVCRATGLAAITDDSGLCVDALGGEPGVYSARYGGEMCRTDADRTALLLRNMDGKSDRTAQFVCCIAVVYPDGRELTAHGTVEGIITAAPRGDGGFGYDPVFEVGGRTLSEMDAADKNAISHRANALAALAKLIEKRN